jgi:prepilin-type N-terminal cleavage/methylation domain-containing protein
MRNAQKGFSLLELLIVVAIILIIAAIAIPNLLRAKIASNQASAVGSLRSLNTACIGYYTRVLEIAGYVSVTAVPKLLSLHGSVGYFEADRKILERTPQDFTDSVVSNAELGHSWEGGATITFARLSLDGSYIFLTNSGNIPFSLKRARLRGEISMTANLSLAAEWLKDRYTESNGATLAGALANYDANRYYVGLHWRP